MRTRLGVLLSTGIVAGVVLAACVPATQPVELTGKDSGGATAVSSGQQLKVSLEANPTTGYQWAVDGTLPDQLEQVGEPVYASGSSAMGAGGVEVWTFVGKAAGTGTLRLKYWRSFEPTVAPVATFSTDVEVK